MKPASKRRRRKRRQQMSPSPSPYPQSALSSLTSCKQYHGMLLNLITLYSVLICVLDHRLPGASFVAQAAPGPFNLMTKMASAASSSTSAPLVKSARLAAYSLTCPPEASIHPCTCLYHNPASNIESEEEAEEEVYEISSAITTPFAEPLVMARSTAAPAPPPSSISSSAPPSSRATESISITTLQSSTLAPTTSNPTTPTSTTTSTTFTTTRPPSSPSTESRVTLAESIATSPATISSDETKTSSPTRTSTPTEPATTLAPKIEPDNSANQNQRSAHTSNSTTESSKPTQDALTTTPTTSNYQTTLAIPTTQQESTPITSSSPSTTTTTPAPESITAVPITFTSSSESPPTTEVASPSLSTTSDLEKSRASFSGSSSAAHETSQSTMGVSQTESTAASPIKHSEPSASSNMTNFKLDYPAVSSSNLNEPPTTPMDGALNGTTTETPMPLSALVGESNSSQQKQLDAPQDKQVSVNQANISTPVPMTMAQTETSNISTAIDRWSSTSGPGLTSATISSAGTATSPTITTTTTTTTATDSTTTTTAIPTTFGETVPPDWTKSGVGAPASVATGVPASQVRLPQTTTELSPPSSTSAAPVSLANIETKTTAAAEQPKSTSQSEQLPASHSTPVASSAADWPTTVATISHRASTVGVARQNSRAPHPVEPAPPPLMLTLAPAPTLVPASSGSFGASTPASSTTRAPQRPAITAQAAASTTMKLQPMSTSRAAAANSSRLSERPAAAGRAIHSRHTSTSPSSTQSPVGQQQQQHHQSSFGHPAPSGRQLLTPNSHRARQPSAAAAQHERPQVGVAGAHAPSSRLANHEEPAGLGLARGPRARRLTRYLASDAYSLEPRAEVVAYCRNIQNPQVLRDAIKGFRGHQVNYFVIDSCKVPPFPNDLFVGIDVRWLEMSNSTVQFHNNFLHSRPIAA